MHRKETVGLFLGDNLLGEEKASCMCAAFPPKTMGRAWHKRTVLTYNETLRVGKMLEEFPEIFIPLFVGWTQHLQITERLLKRGAGMSREKRSGKAGTPR